MSALVSVTDASHILFGRDWPYPPKAEVIEQIGERHLAAGDERRRFREEAHHDDRITCSSPKMSFVTGSGGGYHATFKGYTADLPPVFGGMAGYIKSMYGELPATVTTCFGRPRWRSGTWYHRAR